MQEMFKLKPREPRRNVMIKARMRVDASWSDALILNMSSKGLLVRSERPPNRGSFLEIRRGPYVIVARVIWSDRGRFGVQTQDPVPAVGLLGQQDGGSRPAEAAGAELQERRAAPRPPAARHEKSRQSARVGEFAAVALMCALAAVGGAKAVAEVVAQPLDAAKAALSMQ